MLGEQGEVQESNLNNRSDRLIFFACLQVIEASAQVTQRPLDPVMLVNDLEFQIDDRLIVQKDPDIQDEGLVIDRGAEFDGIGNFHGTDICGSQVQK